ncbi:MAG: cupin [Acidimicrobiia bacterium]|nr:cupin [Acidimicrobiia bacterium]
MVTSSTPAAALPSPDANADRPVPPVDERPAWVVPCPDLDAGARLFEAAGFSLLAIGPADDPRWAVMGSGEGRYTTMLRLDASAHRAGHRHPFLEVDENDPLLRSAEDDPMSEFVAAGSGPIGLADTATTDPPTPTELGSGAAADWVVGRAGMRYRDLLPGRWGGQFIASHIHIPEGGPVPDYVHYHHVDFQLIFCHRGWVRVVYQDQGDPFVLNPGDAILQAPGLRHRVLEASDDLHVIEVSSPAEHATFVEHGLDLPNGFDPGRWYGGQRYVHHRAADVPWATVGTGIRRRSFDLESATGGRYAASVIELEAGEAARVELPVARSVDFELVAILDGALAVTDPTSGRQATFEAGAALGIDDHVTRTARPEQATRLLTVSRHRT